MYKHLFKFALAIIAVGIIQSVIVSHTDNDIRRTILSSFKDKPKKELFKVYHFLFQKKYDLNSEEGIKRYRIFKNNLKFIKEQNAKNLGYTLGFTELTDLSREEFRNTRLMKIDPKKVDADMKKFLNTQNPKASYFDLHAEDDDDDLISNSKSTIKNGNLEQTKIDWTPYMNPAADQGLCGSCWAFATIHAIEGNYKLKYGSSPSFSQQQLVDCDTQNSACEGGSPEDALSYLQSSGVAFKNEYPYISHLTKKAHTCKANKANKANNVTLNEIITGYEYCPYMRCDQTTQRDMLAKGPIVVYVDADGENESSSIFQHYNGGILNLNCTEVTHAVVMIGVDSDNEGEYYIGRNSWGESWGENGGNFRLRQKSSDYSCLMEVFGVLPEVQWTTNPEPPAPVPGCMKLYSKCALEGEVKEICENTPKITGFPHVSGFDIGKFNPVRLYIKENCSGEYYPIDSSDGFYWKTPRKIDSILVEDPTPPTGCIWLYDDYCLTGNKIEICYNVSDLNDPRHKFGNKTSSFKIGPGIASIEIYTDKNYQGSHANLDSSRYGLGTWMDKSIQSIKINLS